MKIFVTIITGKTSGVTEKTYVLNVDPTWCVVDVQRSVCDDGDFGLSLDRTSLSFVGQQLDPNLRLSDCHVTNESKLDLTVQEIDLYGGETFWGSFNIFTSSNLSDPLVRYLMLTDDERQGEAFPLELLKKKAKEEFASPFIMFNKYNFEKSGSYLSGEHISLLCSFLDFMASDDDDWTDMCVSVPDDEFVLLMSSVDELVAPQMAAHRLSDKFRSLFRQVQCSNSERAEPQIVLRMSKGPTNSCIKFHCDGKYATSTSQIALTSPQDYVGGQLCFFVNHRVDFLDRPIGSLVQYPPKVLHGVTTMTSGTRKDLYIVDCTNGIGSYGISVTQDHVNKFLDSRRKRKRDA